MVAAPAENRCASLHLGSDNNRPAQYWPVLDRMIIGRENADIEIKVRTLSRQHAEISPTAGYYQIRDLNSSNGTAVNGVFISSKPVVLKSGDTILLAGNVEFGFFMPNATPLIPRLGSTEGLWIDPVSEAVWIDAQRIEPALSPKQFLLLSLISDAKGKLVTRDAMAHALWPNASPGHISNDAIDSLIKRLRRRLAPLENNNPVFEIIRGRGIRLLR